MHNTLKNIRLVVFWCIWLPITACSGQQAALQSRPPTIIPTATHLPFILTDLTLGQTPGYQGITPGISHKSDVLAGWGTPNVIRTFDKFESLHYFDGSIEEFVLVQNGVVRAITSNVLWRQLARVSYAATMESLSQTLGTPEVITPTIGDPIKVFPGYGLAADGFYAQVFEHASLQEYQAIWGKLPLGLGYDPFPLISSVDAVGITPGQTTRSEVAQLLGTPDRIVYQDRGEPWWYFVEPDMLGRLNIFFNEDDEVESMSIAPFYQSPRPLFFEDMVKQYGPPEIIELAPSFEGYKYERQALVYPNRGLRISTVCLTPDCNAVRRNARVIEKYYFQAEMLEEYKTQFHNLQDPAHEPTYTEWHGFDE
jgi:hypothetical protein